MRDIALEETINKRINDVIDLALKKGVLEFCPQAHEIHHDEEENYHREGFSSEDVVGFVMPSFKEYIRLNKENFLEFYHEFGIWSALKILTIKVPFSYWCWEIDSMEYLGDFVAEEMLYKIEAKDVTKEQKDLYLKENFIQLSNNLWVSKYDKSNILYDNEKKPYALKDGWSVSQLSEILREWFLKIENKDILVRYKRGSEW